MIFKVTKGHEQQHHDLHSSINRDWTCQTVTPQTEQTCVSSDCQKCVSNPYNSAKFGTNQVY